jgi:hypothetical protein
MTLLLLAMVAVSIWVAMTPVPARAAEYPNVAGTQPFTAAANYMSRPGYLRWQTFREQGFWISYAEARRIVQAQQRERGLA